MNLQEPVSQGFLRDPVWQFVGVLIALVAVSLSLWLGLRRTHRLAYEFRIDTLATVAPTLAGQVQIVFRGEVVADVKLVLIRILNAGTQSIRTGDFEQAIRVSFGVAARVLSVQVEKRRPADLPVRPTVEVDAENSPTAIGVAPLLLNPGDFFTLKAFVSGGESAPQFAGRVAGVKEFEMLSRTRETIRTRFVKSFVLMTVSMGGVLLALRVPRAFEFLGALMLMLLAFVASYFTVIGLTGNSIPTDCGNNHTQIVNGAERCRSVCQLGQMCYKSSILAVVLAVCSSRVEHRSAPIPADRAVHQ